MARFNNILETIGNTPIVRINKLSPKGINLFVKVEAFNPLGSVKDRLALGVIEDAEQRGELRPGQTVIEATSGNTGIGLAMVCAQKGYPLVVTMAENFSIERRKLMRFLGAKVVLTPAAEKGSGMLAKAVELANAHGWFLCRQFENEANADIHSRTTAQEILNDFKNERLDYWVTGFGTGGTLKGVSRVLKKERPTTRIIVCEPDNSQILASGIAQTRNPDGSPSGSHPLFRPHLMQGWSPDFIPKLTEDVVTSGHIDRIIPIDGAEALQLAKELAQKEGIFVGSSAGATFSGALKIANEARNEERNGTTILCMLPDTGERYLSTPLFEGISEGMTEEEWEIARSTPNYRFDKPSCSLPTPGRDIKVNTTPEAVAFVEEILGDVKVPVVMFALQWCEFCWSVRKLFKHYDIQHRSVDLDSVEYQADNWGGKIREAVRQKTGVATIPQVFIGGEFIGGCMEVFQAFSDGRAKQLLKSNGIVLEDSSATDPRKFLPGWLQKQ